MSEDEVNEAFEAVLRDAYEADLEADEAAMEEMRKEMTKVLDAGIIPVFVHKVRGNDYVSIPVEIMHSMVEALTEYCDFGQQINDELEQGNAGLIFGSFLSDLQIKALVTKCAFITLAIVNHQEAQMVEDAERAANGEGDES